jgi:hypothetical protein
LTGTSRDGRRSQSATPAYRVSVMPQNLMKLDATFKLIRRLAL